MVKIGDDRGVCYGYCAGGFLSLGMEHCHDNNCRSSVDDHLLLRDDKQHPGLRFSGDIGSVETGRPSRGLLETESEVSGC
jgi:hypothetical protein